jgi:hypothetical protein
MKADSTFTIAELKHVIRKANEPNKYRKGAGLKLTGSKKELQARLKSVGRWRDVVPAKKATPKKKVAKKKLTRAEHKESYKKDAHWNKYTKEQLWNMYEGASKGVKNAKNLGFLDWVEEKVGKPPTKEKKKKVAPKKVAPKKDTKNTYEIDLNREYADWGLLDALDASWTKKPWSAPKGMGGYPSGMERYQKKLTSAEWKRFLDKWEHEMMEMSYGRV